MVWIAGFLLWLAFAAVAGFVMWAFYRGPQTGRIMNYVFAVLGAAVGGMLGVSPYIWHEPAPLRFGGLAGALLGALLFTWMYHFTAKKAL